MELRVSQSRVDLLLFPHQSERQGLRKKSQWTLSVGEDKVLIRFDQEHLFTLVLNKGAHSS